MAKKAIGQKIRKFCLLISFSISLSGIAVLVYQICFRLKQGYWKSFGSRLVWNKVMPASFFQWLRNPNSWLGLNKIISLVFNSSLALFLFVFGLVVFLLVDKTFDLFSKPEKKEQVRMRRWRTLQKRSRISLPNPHWAFFAHLAPQHCQRLPYTTRLGCGDVEKKS